MPAIDRRAILSNFETQELRSLAERCGLKVAVGTSRGQLLDELARSPTPLGEMLMSFSRQRLKEVCRLRGIDDSGREKVLIATRLLGVDPMVPPKPKAVPPIRRVRKKSNPDG